MNHQFKISKGGNENGFDGCYERTLFGSEI